MGARSGGGGMAGWTSGMKKAYKAMSDKNGKYKYSKAKAKAIVNSQKQYYNDDTGDYDLPF